MGDGLVRGAAQWSQATSSEQTMKTRAFLLQGFIQDQIGRMAGETLELTLEQTPQDVSTKKIRVAGMVSSCTSVPPHG